MEEWRCVTSVCKVDLWGNGYYDVMRYGGCWEIAFAMVVVRWGVSGGCVWGVVIGWLVGGLNVPLDRYLDGHYKGSYYSHLSPI